MFMNSWDVSGAFWSFSKCNITIPHLPADPSKRVIHEHKMRANIQVSETRIANNGILIKPTPRDQQMISRNSQLYAAQTNPSIAICMLRSQTHPSTACCQQTNPSTACYQQTHPSTACCPDESTSMAATRGSTSTGEQYA